MLVRYSSMSKKDKINQNENKMCEVIYFENSNTKYSMKGVEYYCNDQIIELDEKLEDKELNENRKKISFIKKSKKGFIILVNHLKG